MRMDEQITCLARPHDRRDPPPDSAATRPAAAGGLTRCSSEPRRKRSTDPEVAPGRIEAPGRPGVPTRDTSTEPAARARCVPARHTPFQTASRHASRSSDPASQNGGANDRNNERVGGIGRTDRIAVAEAAFPHLFGSENGHGFLGQRLKILAAQTIHYRDRGPMRPVRTLVA